MVSVESALGPQFPCKKRASSYVYRHVTTTTCIPGMPDSTRTTHIRRLKDLGDQDAWREFVDRYCRFIRTVARQRGIPWSQLEEVEQEVLIRVAQKIASFEFIGARKGFRRWLERVIAWRAMEWIRSMRRHAGREETVAPTIIESLLYASSGVDRESDRQELLRFRKELVALAIRRLSSRGAPLRAMQMLHWHLVDGRDPASIAKFFHVSPSAVYLAKLRHLPLIRREVRRMLRS